MARIFLDEMGGINQGGILASYGLPMSPFSTEDYVVPTQEIREQPVRATRKKSNKRKTNKKSNNDGIIRNHDSIWDYKIQDGKLLTRRKNNKTWIDISDNVAAVNRIQEFTGKTIGQPKEQTIAKSSKSSEESLRATENTLPQQKGTLKYPRYRTLDTTAGAIDEANDGGFVLDVLDGIYHVLPSTRKQAEAKGETNMLAEYIPKASPIRPEFTLDAMTSNQSRQWLARNISTAMPNFITNMLPYILPNLDKELYQKNLARRRIPYGPYRELMNAIGIDIFEDNKYYPHRFD